MTLQQRCHHLLTGGNVLLYKVSKLGLPGLLKQALLPAEKLPCHSERLWMPVPALTPCLLQQPEAALGRHLPSRRLASAGTTTQVWQVC